jgi:hypothetical protein
MITYSDLELTSEEAKLAYDALCEDTLFVEFTTEERDFYSNYRKANGLDVRKTVAISVPVKKSLPSKQTKEKSTRSTFVWPYSDDDAIRYEELSKVDKTTLPAIDRLFLLEYKDALKKKKK